MATLQPTIHVVPPESRHSPTIARALAELGVLQFRLGNWAAAYASTVESLRAAQASGLEHQVMSGLAHLALIEAARGRADACRSHAAEAVRLSRRHSGKAVEAMAGEAIGFLELGLNRIGAAIERLDSVAQLCDEHPCAGAAAVTCALDLADACLRKGDHAGAQRALTRGEKRAGSSGGCIVAAASTRYRAMLASDDAFEAIFRRALTWSAHAHQPFEQARTKLCYGERLRAARRWPEAGEHLRAALATFEALGAEPWADRARRELATA
jgi:tetratricopeptide (TPR) repeat protein